MFLLIYLMMLSELHRTYKVEW